MRILTCLIVSCCLVLLSSGAAFAELKKFKHFSMDVPAACQVDESDGLVTVVASKDAFFSIGLLSKNEAQNLSDKDFAAKLSEKLQGTAPGPAEKGGYTFFAITNRMLMNVEIVGDNDFMLMYMSDASDKEWPAALQAALESIKGNDPKTEAFIKKTIRD